MSAVAPDLAARAGLTPEDYALICRTLGRAPNPVEARMFAVMWSEHCGYMHSKRVLRRLPTASPRLLRGPGENAGVVAVGDGWAVAFKMESHNHPSAVDPYNGAATGVGGIIRDVLAMGARPIALLDALRFGPLDEPRARRLLAGVVAGIAGYGNAIGVPTVGGEILVDACYRDNPLVNVACLGLVRTDRVASSAAAGPGNVVLYAGARTGRDGIGGAAFASTELDAGREQADRASVQLGDPFTGKLLIEATLQALETGAVVAIQDMGAAGLTCAAAEMAARGGVGMELDVDRVPLREPQMRPDEILLSESQERMLLVVRRDDVARVAAIYRRWGLEAAVIGTVLAEPRLRVLAGGQVVADLPPRALANAPAYEPAEAVPADLEARWALPALPPLDDLGDAVLALLAHPDVASKQAVYEQYDHMVGIRTVAPPGADAAVLRLLEVPPRGVAFVADGNARWCALDPSRGAALVVLEAAANLACVGATPLGLTDCLNFGSPRRPEVFWAFRETVDGLAAACRALGIPVVGGNVSFYNEAEGAHDRAILPTPIVAMVGLVDDVAAIGRMGFVRAGDRIVLLGPDSATLGASLHARLVTGRDCGRPAAPAFAAAVAATALVRDAVRQGVLRSAHDCSEGGLAVALAEACIAGGIGATVALPAPADGDGRRAWFGEGPGRFVVSCLPEHVQAITAAAAAAGVPCAVLGTVGGDALCMQWTAGSTTRTTSLPLDALVAAWTSLEV
ncbi:MAG: phosphoribosylformylglycinamidine synthase subunit PurL [Armatimonadota bacterium]|nr:phosphoribosylformylglycinamidine synthase subunit PurL [Armatimonadota bacterium]